MDAREAIQLNIDCANMICSGYLNDLSDADLLVRPVPGVNHIAWQLGHLISSEHQMVAAVSPDKMPALPEGFAAAHSKETAGSDDASKFLKKDEYLKLMAEQRAGTLAALKATSDAQLASPAPEAMQGYCKSVADLFSLQGSHWMMHAGQWAVTRRKLGRPPLF